MITIPRKRIDIDDAIRLLPHEPFLHTFNETKKISYFVNRDSVITMMGVNMQSLTIPAEPFETLHGIRIENKMHHLGDEVIFVETDRKKLQQAINNVWL